MNTICFVTVTALRDAYNKGLFFVSYLSNYVYCYLKRTIGLRLFSVFRITVDVVCIMA